MRHMKKAAVALIVSCSLITASSAYAFSDIKDSRQEQIATVLHSKGIIQGVAADKFAPMDKLTAAQGVQMVVKAMDLKANDRGPEPGTTPSGAWYAQAVRIAAQNGLPVASFKNWNANLTKEQFAGMLYKAVSATGTYPTIEMYMKVTDEDQIGKEAKGAVQFLLLTGIASLDAQGSFHPKQYLTRMEAAELTYHALQFIQKHQSQPIPEEAEDGVSVQTVKVNDQVNEVILSKSDMPNPGYGMMLDRIEFLAGQKAVAYYHFTTPEPGKMYPQVISTAKISFYIDSDYKVSIQKLPDEERLPISIPRTDQVKAK